MLLDKLNKSTLSHQGQIIQGLLARKSQKGSRIDHIIYAFFKPNVDDDGFAKKGRAVTKLETGHVVPGLISMQVHNEAKNKLNEENTRFISNEVRQLDPTQIHWQL